MRIRLEIKRHELPPVKIIFAIPDAPTSISKLVELVNDLIPLEAEDWGLEDYIVSVGDYECLHYMDAHAVLHDNDAVEIRAMQSSDIRTRRVSSRYQVSSGGAHLIDGIAYGRSYVKRSGRPAVRIPPLKRPRLLYDEPEDEWSDDALGADIDTESHPGQLRITSSFQDADGDESGENGDEGIGNDAENLSAAPARRTLRSKTKESANTVRFEGIDEAMQDDDDESDEEDFVPDDSEPSDEHFDDSDSSSRESPTPQMGSDAAPQAPSQTTTKQDQIPKSAEGAKAAARPSSAGISMSSQPVVDPPSSSNSSGSGNENDAEDSKTISLAEYEPDVQEPKVSGPGAGSAATKARNQRRKNSKKRDREVSQPVHKRLETANESVALDSQNLSGSQRTHLRFLDEPTKELGADTVSPMPSQIEAVVSQSDGKTQTTIQNVLVSQTRQNDREEPPEQISSRQPPNSSRNVSPQFGVTSTLVNKLQDTEKAKEGETSPPSATRRAKIDLASSRRLVFGSLGVRAPKNKAEESKLQAKLAQTNSSSSSKTASKQSKDNNAAKSAQTPTRIFTGDEWKEKIILSAEECYDEGVRLSTPPFPFVQRWDPQQQRGKKRKRAERGYYDGHFDNENGLLDEEGNAEYYDDGDYNDVDVDYDEEDPEAGLEVYDEAEKEKAEDDLPLPPEDLTTLLELKQSACQPGQVIAFKQLEVSQATNWAPTMSAHKTAQINAVHPKTGSMELTLALRDVQVQDAEYDEEGNRIYGKFEMPQGDEEDEEDPRRIEVQFDELVDPRILVDAPAQTPPIVASDGDADAGAASPIEETFLIPDSLRPHDDDHVADADIEDELEDSPALVPHSHSHSHSHSQQEQTTTKSRSKAESQSNTSAPNPYPRASTTATTSNEPSQAFSSMSSADAPATVANSGLDQAAQLPASLGSSNPGEAVQDLKEMQGVQEMPPLMVEGTSVVEARAG